MRFRLKNKSYVLNTKIKLVGKDGANLSIITSDINNPTSNYNLTANTITFCLSPLPAVIGDPEVIVNEHTTSALNFENGVIDQVPTTIWNKSGTAGVTTNNKIFGENSFETKSLGDGLYTNSNIITGGSTPFTIEFYVLVKGGTPNNDNWTPLFNADSTQFGWLQGFYRDLYTQSIVYFRNHSSEYVHTQGFSKIKNNEITKITITYDSSALRVFTNDILDFTTGTDVGLFAQTLYTFFSKLSNNLTTYGLIDNINIHNHVALKTRNYDPYEEFLVVDLAFDGENNSTKIVDNGTLKSVWTVNGSAKISTDQKFDGFSSMLVNGDTSFIKTYIDLGPTFTIEFEFITPSKDSGYHLCLLDYGDGSLGYSGFNLTWSSSGNIWWRSGYSSNLASNTNLVAGRKYKITLIYNNGTRYLYVNDKLDASSVLEITTGLKAFSIGYSNTDWKQTLNYYIGHCKIYSEAVIPEDPTGKIQLDFDENVIDKYGNSTWTNNGVTFDQVNSVKGYAIKFDNNTTSNIRCNTNDNLNFENKDFKLTLDAKITNKQSATALIMSGGSGNYYHLLFGNSSNDFGIYHDNSTIRAKTEVYATPSNYSLNNYYNLNILRKNNVINLYTNNVLVAQRPLDYATVYNFNNDNSTTIGSSYNSLQHFTFNGYIDNFKSIKDYQETVVIDKPAVHLSLETNAINTGFTPLAINSVGNPTYHVVDGKKCIKFESGKYLTINSNNIFNFSTNSDFYIEFDFYPLVNKYHHLISAGSTVADLTTIAMGGSQDGNSVYVYAGGVYILTTEGIMWDLNKFNNIKLYRKGILVTLSVNGHIFTTTTSSNFDFSKSYTTIGQPQFNTSSYCDGYMSNFKMFVGTSEIPETYNDKAVLDLDFKPTRKSYLFKDNNNKCVIHPVNITQRDYQDSQYCCTFNGTNQYLQLGKNDLLNFGNDDFVINIKFKIKEFSSSWMMLLGDNVSSTNWIDIASDRKLAVKLGGARKDSIVNLLQVDIFYSLVLQMKNNMLTVFLNDNIISLDGNNNNTFTNVNFNMGDNTSIGRYNYSSDEYFNGTIYSIKVLRNTSDLSLLEDV